jgi:hypothetical protein
MIWPRADDFRSIPINGHRYRASACLKCAKRLFDRFIDTREESRRQFCSKRFRSF